MFATITLLACLQLVLLFAAAALTLMVFSYWVSTGTFFGWWMANDMVDLMGHIITAIAHIIQGMMSND